MSSMEEKIKKMLPKTYLRKHVAHEIYVVLRHFKNIKPMMEKYVYNDGTTKDLMSLTGTIPVMYGDMTYNIPICLWVEENYPQTAPICFVKPTHDMMIIRGKYISGDGEVRLPYLQEWKHGECDLASLLQVMAATFGDSPPLSMQSPEREQASCRLQFQRGAEVLSNTDGSLYLSLAKEDARQEKETNC